MTVHLNKIEFMRAVKYTAETMGTKEVYVEKDYWVTYALFTIFNNEIGKENPSAKCWGE